MGRALASTGINVSQCERGVVGNRRRRQRSCRAHTQCGGSQNRARQSDTPPRAPNGLSQARTKLDTGLIVFRGRSTTKFKKCANFATRPRAASGRAALCRGERTLGSGHKRRYSRSVSDIRHDQMTRRLTGGTVSCRRVMPRDGWCPCIDGHHYATVQEGRGL